MLRILKLINKALMLKLKWIILIDKEAVWAGILKQRYINLELKLFINDDKAERNME